MRNNGETTRETGLLVLAAGMGSRYGGVKQIEGVGPNGEALIDYSLYDALESGFNRIVFVVREEIRRDVEEFFSGKIPSEVTVRFVNQRLDDLPGSYTSPANREKPWGTAHAVYAARDEMGVPFTMINGDDFYGRESFQAMADFLRERHVDETVYSLVGFRLDRTLSPHGSVSRALCEVDADGNVATIAEHKSIHYADGGIVSEVSGSQRTLTGSELTSMNMFGFTPAVFTQVEHEMTRFLSDNIGDPKAEFYVPWALNNLISAGRATLTPLSTDAQWFGMTYREDKPTVEEAIQRYVDAGVYPSRLWE
ncbi:MAG: nucleotidyltransferase family protein [Spirochaetota bacterium]